MSRGYRVFGLDGIPEIEPGDDLSALLAEAAARSGGLESGDVVVVAQKIVSKAEGRIVDLDTVTKKQLKALAEQKLQCQLTGDRRTFLDSQIDFELANM